MRVFDRKAVRRNRAQADRPDAPDCDFLFAHMQGAVRERLADVRRVFPRALQHGVRARHAPDYGDKAGRLFTMDWDAAQVVADGEFLPFAPQSFDLVTDIFTLHAVNDVPGALAQKLRLLKPDGLFLAAFPGGESLYELRESLMQAEMAVDGGVSPRIFPFIEKQQAGALMQRAQFALPVVDSERVIVTYDHPLKLMRELRMMGEGNAIAERRNRFSSRALFAAACDYYFRHFSEPDGRIRATFEIIYLTGWAPHESQQKPLPRGSGKISLAAALADGEKPS